MTSKGQVSSILFFYMFNAILTSIIDLICQKISFKKFWQKNQIDHHFWSDRISANFALKSFQETIFCIACYAFAIYIQCVRFFVLWRYVSDLACCACTMHCAGAATSPKNKAWPWCHVFNVFLLRGSCKHMESIIFLFLLVLHVSALLLVQFWAKTTNYSLRNSCLHVCFRSSKKCCLALRAITKHTQNPEEAPFLDLPRFLIWRLF